MVHVDELLVSGFSFEALGAEGGLIVLPLRSLLLHVCLNWLCLSRAARQFGCDFWRAFDSVHGGNVIDVCLVVMRFSCSYVLSDISLLDVCCFSFDVLLLF